MSKYFVLLFFASCSLLLSGQSKLDSLRQKLQSKNLPDSTRANIYHDIATIFEEKAEDSCLFYGNLSLNISKKINYTLGLGRAYNTIGSYHNGKGEYQLAIENFINGYKIYELAHNKRAMSNLMNSIGNTYLGSDNQIKALEAYTQSYEIAQSDSNKYMMAISSIGLGNIYLLKKDANQAIYFFSRAKNIFQNMPTALYPLSVTYTLIGNALIELNKYDEAFVNLNKAVDQLKTLNNTYGIAATYQVIGEAYQKKGNLDLSIDYFLKSFEIFSNRKAYDDLKNVSLNLSNAYKQQHNYEKSLEYYTKYSSFKDSVLGLEKNKQLLEVSTKFETEKKEQQNIILKKQNDLSNERIRRQKVANYFIIGSLIASLLFGIFMYRVYSQKKKANILITKQKEQVEIKQREIEDQKQLVELKQKEIVDSINYARRIQYALLAHEDLLNKNLFSKFILFKPKDIVSGDFYWATEHGDDFYMAVCDSTGHGVPGAFMSLLSIGFLSEAIKEKNIKEPNNVFNYVRNRLIESITNEGQKDGFDGVLLRFNKKNNSITYAAANNRPVVISNNEINYLSCDKMPVGIGEKEDEFQLNSINVSKGDIIYLYTDGYADQFGGEKGKKFKYKPLNDMLLQISNKSLTEQKELLDAMFINWKGNLEQVDDVLIVGIKV